MQEFEDITQLFQNAKAENKYLNVAAPMVRYSKLEFRRLLRKNNVKLCFTPMIVANSFNHSQEARRSEFSTSKDDRPLIAQFAAHNSLDMLAASELVSPFVDGVDVNCGCPQSWATAKGYGCALLRKPEVVEDIVKTLRRNLSSTLSVSLKLRLLHSDRDRDTRSTTDLCRQLEKCGTTFLVIHGRTQWQKTSHPVDVDAMAEIKKSIQIPLIVNGDVKTIQDAQKLYEQTEADGVMVARGLLANPALFTGAAQTTTKCLHQWLDIATTAGEDLSFQNFHHHLTFMWGKMMKRQRRVIFNNFSTKQQVYNFFGEEYGIWPKIVDSWSPNLLCKYPEHLISQSNSNLHKFDSIGTHTKSDGNYFKSFNQNVYEADTALTSSHDDLLFKNGSIFDL